MWWRWRYGRWLRLIESEPIGACSPIVHVLLVAPHSSYRISPYLRAAQSLGVRLQIASQGEYSIVSQVAAGLNIDLGNHQEAVEKICQAANDTPFTAIVATDDATVEIASLAAQALGLEANSPDAARLSRRKDLARQRLSAAGVPCPIYQRIDLDQSIAAQVDTNCWPAVVKPIALSGSRGVIRVDNLAELEAACARIRGILDHQPDTDEQRFLLLESFVPGPEVAVEGILQNGRLEILTLFDKPDPLDGPYFEETYYVTPSRHGAVWEGRIFTVVQQACAAYGLTQGPIHAELRLYQDQAWMIEMAARTIGGQCARLLEFGAGRSLEELVLARAVGLECPVEKSHQAAGVLMLPIPEAGFLRRVEGLAAATAVPLIEEIEISVQSGYELVPLPDGSSYLGFIFARASSPQLVEEALRVAHSKLNFVVSPKLPVSIG